MQKIVCYLSQCPIFALFMCMYSNTICNNKQTAPQQQKKPNKFKKNMLQNQMLPLPFTNKTLCV